MKKLYKKITISSLEDTLGETFSEGFPGNLRPKGIIYTVNCKFLGKKTSILFNYYKRML